MSVHVSREGSPRARITTAAVRAMADRMLRALALDRCELSVVLTDDPSIEALNREHRKKDRPTDVLAFSQNEDERGRFVAFDLDRPVLLGDVVISLDTASEQARAHSLSLEAEVALLLAHGLLHLLGCDHRDDHEERRMKARTQVLAHAAIASAKPGRSRRRPADPPAIAGSSRRDPGKTR